MSSLIMHIVGNRPQFIKLAPVSKAIRARGYREVIIHSGQHYDENMSDVFFDELGIAKPERNLHISGGTHAEMTAKMMLALEPVMLEFAPDVVILYGDTNTTLAAALTAAKLNIPVVHVEAGPRTGNMRNPEEVNRVIVDRISALLCAPDESSMQNLIRENLQGKAVFSGDVMYDTFLSNRERINGSQVLENYSLAEGQYILMTWHRQENTSDRESMLQIIELLEAIPYRIVCPLHPRTEKMLQQFGLWERAVAIRNLLMIEPVGYIEMVALLSGCRMTLTDSGGLSKESFFAEVKCLFMLDLSVWPELEQSEWILHKAEDIETNLAVINNVFSRPKQSEERPAFYGNGNAAGTIVKEMENRFHLTK